jgi:hypothetical protein
MQRSQNLAFAVSFAVMILLLISVSFAISYAQHGIDPNWSAQLAITKSAATVSADGAVANNIWASRTSAFFTQLTTLQASDHQFSRTFVMYIATIHRYTPSAIGNRCRENFTRQSYFTSRSSTVCAAAPACKRATYTLLAKLLMSAETLCRPACCHSSTSVISSCPSGE